MYCEVWCLWNFLFDILYVLCTMAKFCNVRCANQILLPIPITHKILITTRQKQINNNRIYKKNKFTYLQPSDCSSPESKGAAWLLPTSAVFGSPVPATKRKKQIKRLETGAAKITFFIRSTPPFGIESGYWHLTLLILAYVSSASALSKGGFPTKNS